MEFASGQRSCHWMALRERVGTENCKKNFRLRSVDNSLWKRLWICRTTEYWLKVLALFVSFILDRSL
jgi:transposase